jgi:hypothetical protein
MAMKTAVLGKPRARIVSARSGMSALGTGVAQTVKGVLQQSALAAQSLSPTGHLGNAGAGTPGRVARLPLAVLRVGAEDLAELLLFRWARHSCCWSWAGHSRWCADRVRIPGRFSTAQRRSQLARSPGCTIACTVLQVVRNSSGGLLPVMCTHSEVAWSSKQPVNFQPARAPRQQRPDRDTVPGACSARRGGLQIGAHRAEFRRASAAAPDRSHRPALRAAALVLRPRPCRHDQHVSLSPLASRMASLFTCARQPGQP